MNISTQTKVTRSFGSATLPQIDVLAEILAGSFGATETEKPLAQLKGRWLLQVQAGENGRLRAFSIAGGLHSAQQAAQAVSDRFGFECAILPPAGFP